MMSLSNHFIPEDTIIEVLTRLPVKTLIRFKCASKNWNILIVSPSFCLKHIKKYNDDNARLVVSYRPINSDLNYSLCLFQDETLEDLLSHQELMHQMPIYGYDKGLHLGIFCLFGDDNRITLWNLATREYRTLPRCRAALPPYKILRYTNIGFGLDPTSNDRKLILIRSFWDGIEMCAYKYAHVALFSLPTNSWTRIKGNEWINYRVEHQYNGTYLDGVCYWLAYVEHEDDYDHQFVLSFCIGDETFQEIERPAEISVLTMTFLGLCNNLLAYLVFSNPDKFMEIWIRNGTVWSRYLCVGPIPVVLWPLQFWKNDQFFIQSQNSELLLFDPSTQKLTDIGLRYFGSSVYKYKESLISIKENGSILEDDDIPWHTLGVYSTEIE